MSLHQWFDRQKVYLDSLESQLKSLVKAIEMVAKQRQGKLNIHRRVLDSHLDLFEELALVNGEFAQTMSDLASSDVGAQLSQSLSGLADVERKAQELQMIQSDHDMVTIMATSDEYSRLINSVRVSLFPFRYSGGD
jgi:sorting nexin-1/2